MIYYLATEHALYTLLKFLELWQDRLGRRLIPVSYRRLLQLKDFPAGTYIFSDLDRLTGGQAERVTGLWKQLSRSGRNRLLNHPTRSMQRYALLRHLHKRRSNQFNVYILSECRAPAAFPVFIRFANRHNGAISSLLRSQTELDQAVEGILKSGEGLEDKLMIEFCDTADKRGVFRKYSAYLIGEQIIPSALLFRPDWHVKHSTLPLAEELHVEKVEYLKTNPHEKELREIFQAAGIDYGRIDYAIRDGRIQTWEINTNPDISSLCTKKLDPWNVVDGIPTTQYLSQKFLRAFEALDGLEVGPDCALRFWHLNKTEEILSAFEQCVPVGARVLWVDGPEACGLGNWILERQPIPFPGQDGPSGGCQRTTRRPFTSWPGCKRTGQISWSSPGPVSGGLNTIHGFSNIFNQGFPFRRNRSSSQSVTCG